MTDERDDAGPRRRLTRKEGQARTRSLLLEAAASVFAKKGFAGASVEDIAEAAGYSTGALYSNFTGKEELFLELLHQRTAGRMSDALGTIGDNAVPIEQRRTALAELLLTIADGESDSVVLEGEFWLYAMRRPDLQQQLSDQFRDNRDALGELMADWARTQGHSRPMPIDDLATTLLGLFQGLVHLRRTDTALVPDQLYADAIRWIVAGLLLETGNLPRPT